MRPLGPTSSCREDAESSTGSTAVAPDEEAGQWVRLAAQAQGLDHAVCLKVRHGDREVDVALPDADGRIALILMDYPNQRRLKIWGRARVVHEGDEPGLIGHLAIAGYKARVERAIVIAVSAFDWNCPQHITPRFTEAEVAAAVAPLKAELASLRARLADHESRGT